MKEEKVILVNERDEAIGTMEKMAAHQAGVLHRAFSILVMNDQGEMLLQQRAYAKYHCGGLWTNACCSHQREGESTIDAARRRLKEEMGMVANSTLKPIFSFIYKANLDRGLVEHEFDHVLMMQTSDIPIINPAEVEDWKYVPVEVLLKEVAVKPEIFTPWFRLILEQEQWKI